MADSQVLRVPMYYNERRRHEESRRVRLFDLLCYQDETLLEFKMGRLFIQVDKDNFFHELIEKERMAKNIIAHC